MCMRVTVVCLFVRPKASARIRCVCDKLNLPVKSLENSKGFQLTDFAKRLLSQVIARFSFSHSQVGYLQFIEVVTWQVRLTIDLYLRVLRVGDRRQM